MKTKTIEEQIVDLAEATIANIKAAHWHRDGGYHSLADIVMDWVHYDCEKAVQLAKQLELPK